MVTEIRVYFEGDASLRQGFRRFLDEIYVEARRLRCRVELIATGSTPIDDYLTARRTHAEAWNILLLDSDGPFASFEETCRNKHLRQLPLEGSTFWMIQIMESWFLADPEALRGFYGKGFNGNAVGGNPNVEEISKGDVYSRLDRATRGTGKGQYHKTHHAPFLLECIDPVKVRTAASGCDRLFRAVLDELGQG